MRINEIKDGEINATLTADDLILIHNALYEKEKDKSKKATARAHNLAAQIVIAMNLCQYGHLDDFALYCAVKHKIRETPNGKLASLIRKPADKTEAKKQTVKPDQSQDTQVYRPEPLEHGQPDSYM